MEKLLEKLKGLNEEQLEKLEYEIDNIVEKKEPNLKEFEIDGIIEAPEFYDQNVILDLFIHFVESQGMYFCGTIGEYKED